MQRLQKSVFHSLAPQACSACFLLQPRTKHSTFYNGLGLPKTTIKKVLHICAQGSTWWRNFFIWSSFFPGDPALCQVKKQTTQDPIHAKHVLYRWATSPALVAVWFQPISRHNDWSNIYSAWKDSHRIFAYDLSLLVYYFHAMFRLFARWEKNPFSMEIKWYQ